MNKLIINAVIATMALVILLPLSSKSQEKKVHVKTVKVVDGEKIVTDTIFVVKEGEDESEVIKTFTWVSDDDSAGVVTYDIDIDSDIDSDVDFDGHSKVIIMKRGKDGNMTMKHGGKEKKYVIKVEDEEGDEHNVFIYDGSDFHKSDMDELHEKLEEHKDQLKNIRIELDGEKIIMLEEPEELESLMELKEIEILVELDELENMNIVIPEMPEYHDFLIHDYHGHDVVSEKELRDAGIKNKADRLDIDNYNINIDDGVVDLDFSLKTEGDPKVTVFNYFGDKVYSGKPEMMNGKYVIKIDLSNKQHGTYYLQVVQKNSSFTKKLRL